MGDEARSDSDVVRCRVVMQPREDRADMTADALLGRLLRAARRDLERLRERIEAISAVCPGEAADIEARANLRRAEEWVAARLAAMDAPKGE